MQSGEDEVAGLGGGDGDRGRLEVTQLADEDDVRVLAQDGAARRRSVGVDADLALVDHAGAVRVQVLDRVLDRDDVAVRVLFATSSRLASVVDLPEPVGPVTRTSPRGRWANCSTDPGRPSSCSDLIFCGIVRNAAPTEPRCR